MPFFFLNASHWAFLLPLKPRIAGHAPGQAEVRLLSPRPKDRRSPVLAVELQSSSCALVAAGVVCGQQNTGRKLEEIKIKK